MLKNPGEFDHSSKISRDCHMTRMAGEVTRFVRQGVSTHQLVKVYMKLQQQSITIPYRQSTLRPVTQESIA